LRVEQISFLKNQILTLLAYNALIAILHLTITVRSSVTIKEQSESQNETALDFS
jgi:hypothetical protein